MTSDEDIQFRKHRREYSLSTKEHSLDSERPVTFNKHQDQNKSSIKCHGKDESTKTGKDEKAAGSTQSLISEHPLLSGDEESNINMPVSPVVPASGDKTCSPLQLHVGYDDLSEETEEGIPPLKTPRRRRCVPINDDSYESNSFDSTNLQVCDTLNEQNERDHTFIGEKLQDEDTVSREQNEKKKRRHFSPKSARCQKSLHG